ncbi:MBL fold metallo-hydrolase [Caproiciproducens sp. NJN-50]|uniref:MBL fold metallo-hydrolase n=1 Tax=Acutalibacteraceae TaxID=3082771 RepID=UPI000FFE2BE9|nr:MULTISPECIES: MBL fold metallo-hydrolase [Acutalibacteraceae]QAT49972.1 MBL fold metallo-hydrolase [Caproiciproducens sp. NJN-50]
MKLIFQTSPERDYQDGIITVTNVGACPGGEAFLIVTEQKAALVDSGFSFCADKMIENIKKLLGSRTLDYVLLTHSHYDHASGSASCRLYFKNVKIVASAYAAKIFSKPSAIAVMREMNASAAQDYGILEFEDHLDQLHVDLTVSEGDTIDLGDISLRVMEAPGHTKCSIAFYIPEEKMLISCETMGVYAAEHLVSPSYLVGYEISLNFIKRALNMEIEKLLVPHYGVLTGKACGDFLTDALRSNQQLKEMIVEDYRKGKTQTEIIDHYRDIFYTEECRRTQPLRAFNLNASHLVPMVLKEVWRRSNSTPEKP